MSSSSELTEGDLEGGLIRRLNRPHTLRGLTSVSGQQLFL